MKNNELLNFNEAIKLIDENAFLNKSVSFSFEKCTGLILAESIIASNDIPAFTNSAMDGFAVKSEDLTCASKTNPANLEVIETVAAGTQSTKIVSCGKCAAIMTGAPMPQGADAIVKVEDTERAGNIVKFFAPIPMGENVRFKGEEAKKGDSLVQKDTVVTPGVIGLASSLGMTKLNVFEPSKIAIIITGDEVLHPGSQLQPGKIIDATGPALKSALISDNFPVSYFEYVKDNPADIEKVIKTAISKADVIIIAGGASMGEYDFIQDCLTKIGAKKIFWKVAVKPGKPTWFGKFDDKIIFNLPGNPVSVIVTYYLYVRFLLRRQLGYNSDEARLKKTMVKLEKTLTKTDQRLEFVRGIAYNNIVTPIQQRGSAMLSGMANANCLIKFPRYCEKISAGENVEILTFDI